MMRLAFGVSLLMTMVSCFTSKQKIHNNYRTIALVQSKSLYYSQGRLEIPDDEVMIDTSPLTNQNYNNGIISSRRVFVRSLLTPTIASVLTGVPQSSWSSPLSSSNGSRMNEIDISIKGPEERLGLELVDVTIGTNPPRSVVSVKSITNTSGLAARKLVQPGMVLLDWNSAQKLVQNIQRGPYPIQLTFTNLAGQGDAYGDDQKTIVTPDDALDLARRISRDSLDDNSRAAADNRQGYTIQVVQKPNLQSCEFTSRRGDVMEIQYTAQFERPSPKNNNDDNNAKEQIVYDSSAERGTGLPYQFVLGSGDMLPGVDQGLYDMCPGEIREIGIPKELGYGDRGNKLFRVPAGVRLNWTVELIHLNTFRDNFL